MANEKKMTKREVFEALKAIPENAEFVEFLDAQIAQLDARAEKAKERKAKKAAESDALKQKIAEALTEDLQTADEITEKVADGDEEITKAKVVARLSQLVKSAVADKTQVKVDGRRIMAYAIAGSIAAEDEDAE